MLCGHCARETPDSIINFVSKISQFSGISCRCSYEVTPVNQKCDSYDEESWRATSEDYVDEEKPWEPDPISTPLKSGNTKGVKKYLKKCKNVLVNNNNNGSSNSSSSNSSICKSNSFKNNSLKRPTSLSIENQICEGEIHEIDDDVIFEIGILEPLEEIQLNLQVATIVYVNGPINVNNLDCLSKTDINQSDSISKYCCYNSTVNNEESSEEEEDKFYSLPGDDEQSNQVLLQMSHNIYETNNIQKTSSNNSDTVVRFSTETNTDDINLIQSNRQLQSNLANVSCLLNNVQETAEDIDCKIEIENGISQKEIISKTTLDLENLINKYFGCIYGNYAESKKCLIRQARDVLVCEYHGCLDKFEKEFCMPASKLLQHLKNDYKYDGATPSGWPFCLGHSGIILHLTDLDSIHIRNGDCYLCCRKQNSQSELEIVFIWKIHQQIHIRKIAAVQIDSLNSNLDAIRMCSSIRSVSDLEEISVSGGGCLDDCDCADLPELLQNLLVSVENAIKKVPLDDLPFPCPQCHQYLPLDRQEENDNNNDDDLLSSRCACQCLCRLPDNQPLVIKKDSSMQTSPMFEFDGTIPHIDSDSDDDKETYKSGLQNKKIEVALPKTISELPDKLLMSGINLPGTTDRDERPIILCYAECITRAALNKYEIAKLLLYYTSIPTKETKQNGFTVLLLAENEIDNKVLELLNKSICLIGNCIDIRRCLIWAPAARNKNDVRTLTSQIEAIIITEESTLDQYLHKEQTPASCGGTCSHDQLEWVEFFKQLEPFVVDCRSAGKSLLSTLAQLRNENVPLPITRRFLNHQCRQITKALEFEIVQKLKREGNKTLNNLIERSQWLSSSQDVKRATNSACDSFNAVDRVTRRLEQLKMERVNRLKELARYRILQEEIEELHSWCKKIGETTLNDLTLLLRTSSDSNAVKEVANSFDDFFFKAWKQIEKSNDLLKECKNIQDAKGQHLKDLTENVHFQLRNFKEKLEETRERIEDSSRCFLLLESCHDILEDDNKEQEEFIQLAQRSGNEKLLQLCGSTKKCLSSDLKQSNQQQQQFDSTSNPDKGLSFFNFGVKASSTPQKSQNTQIRRRSVSSMAYIYHCSHHAAGELCNCCESETENSMSYKLKRKYIQMQTIACQCGNRDSLEKKNGSNLVGIKEERESAENLLEKFETIDNFRRCDSGFSTITDNNSIGEESLNSFTNFKKKLQTTCSCQYYRERCAICSSSGGTTSGSSSGGSNQDNNENQQDSITEEGSDGFNKSNSSDDIEDDNYGDERRKVLPVSANNHLYCHTSDLDLPSDALYINMDPKTQKTLKYIINEMIETERDYVKSLDYIIVNYIPELQREDIPQALRGQRNTVFGNVEKIYEFHSHHFLGELEECENNPLQVGNIFLKYDKRFYLYALYNKNKPKSDSLMSEYGTSFFKTKQLELEDKMDLASYLLKPVQRMGKYALLLQQMMKACPQSLANSTERVIQELEDLRQAEEMVRFQLRHGNDLLAMDSIRECDVNLKEQGRLLRQNEFLVWEGRTGKKTLRQVFLFEELILFSKARRFPDRKNLDLYIYKNSIKMTDIGLTARIGESPTKFEIWFRKRKPNDTFTLQSMSEDVKKAWSEELSQLLWKQAIKNRALRMAEMSSMGIGNKPCLDIRPSADQINDRSISFAQLSKTVPRFRNSIASAHVSESCRTVKRPHSVISMSSVSSSSTSSGGSAGNSVANQNCINSNSIGFESNFDGSRSLYNNRSATLNSQCSVESGIISDISVALEEYSSTETNQQQQSQPNG